jgi:hypothetical protein
MRTSSTGSRPEHSFAPVIGSTGCVGHLIWTARGVRAFDADDKEIGTYASMDQAAAILLERAVTAQRRPLMRYFGWGAT